MLPILRHAAATLGAWLLVALLLGPSMPGCASAPPAAPAEWASRPAVSADPDSFDEPIPALQVLICHGRTHGTHTGLRLLRPPLETVFWDPAGQFGRGREDLVRRRDVFHRNAPTAADYVAWRFDGAGDTAVTIFEWRLDRERAGRLAAILTRTAEGIDFETTTVGLFCCRAVCRFLERYAQEEMEIPQRWIRPEDLARHLWSQRPTRVGIFRADGGVEVYHAPD